MLSSKLLWFSLSSFMQSSCKQPRVPHTAQLTQKEGFYIPELAAAALPAVEFPISSSYSVGPKHPTSSHRGFLLSLEICIVLFHLLYFMKLLYLGFVLSCFILSSPTPPQSSFCGLQMSWWPYAYPCSGLHGLRVYAEITVGSRIDEWRASPTWNTTVLLFIINSQKIPSNVLGQKVLF